MKGAEILKIIGRYAESIGNQPEQYDPPENARRKCGLYTRCQTFRCDAAETTTHVPKAAIRGNAKGIVQGMFRPNCAPA